MVMYVYVYLSILCLIKLNYLSSIIGHDIVYSFSFVLLFQDCLDYSWLFHLHFQVHFRNSLFNFYYITAKITCIHCSVFDFLHVVYFGGFSCFVFICLLLLCWVLLTLLWCNRSVLNVVGRSTYLRHELLGKMSLNKLAISKHVETTMKMQSFIFGETTMI